MEGEEKERGRCEDAPCAPALQKIIAYYSNTVNIARI